MNPEAEAIPFIEANLRTYGLTWKNTDRVSTDWKAKLYEHGLTGRQFAIYARESTVVRLEEMVSGINGVEQLAVCPKSHALNASFSRFKYNQGVCVAVSSKVALKELLERYFSQVSSPRSLADVTSAFEIELAIARNRTSAERQARLAKAPKKPVKATVQTSAFIRNPDVVAEVLARANGACEACRSSAPFNRASNGEPYLEVHHIVPLSADGDDTVENAVALCPNCHREKHYGVREFSSGG